MDSTEIAVGISIAIVMVAVAVYFTWSQGVTLQTLRSDPTITTENRRYLYKQCWRRLFGSLVLAMLAAMLVGSLFLDYDPLRRPIDELPIAEKEAAKQAVRFVSFYWMSILMFLMAIMALAVFDLWATARHSVMQQKRLFQEHQEQLEADLEELRHRQSDMN